MSSFQIFSDGEIASLRRGGKILAGCLQHVAAMVRPGITTHDLDSAAEAYICGHGGIPAFKGYRGFPGSLCISVNDECVHGIPGPRILGEGDIVSLDGGVILDDLYTDACVTVPAGKASAVALSLITTAEEALAAAVALVRAGCRVGDLSATIEEHVRAATFHPIPALTGHGLGTKLHQFPDIPNVGTAGKGPILPANTIIAIEPIIAVGTPNVREAADGWTLKTADGSFATHSEHTVLVLENSCEILA